MPPSDWPSRRQLLKLGGTVGVGLLAGCNSRSEQGDTTDVEPTERSTTKTITTTETVTFTDTTTTERTPTELVFDGGDLRSFVDALTKASEIPDATLQVEPGTYRFEPIDDVAPGEKDPHARIDGVEDVTIEASDATFVFTDPLRAGLQFFAGSDITIRGLTVDYDPVPFTQGEIVDVSEDGARVTLALDDGYPSLSHDMFDHADRVWASVHEADGSFVTDIRKDGSFDKFFDEITQVGDRRFELHIRNNPKGVSVGRRLTIVARNQGTVLDFYKIDSPTIEAVSAHASGGAVFGLEVCSDPVVRGTEIVPPADSTRQVASDADGIRVVNCSSSVTIEGCHHEQLLDDSIVVQHTFAEVTDVPDDHTIAVENVHPFVVTEGDVLGVQSVTGERKGTLPPIEDYDPRFTAPGDRLKPATITFEAPIADTVEEGDYVGNEATGSQNFSVRNNELRNHRGILVRVTAGPGEVANNTLTGASRNPIELESHTDSHFSPKGWCNDVTVRENTIRRAGLVYFAGEHPAAIRCHHKTFPGTPTRGQPHRNIEILDNDIRNCAQLGIDVEATQGVRISGNSISGVNQLNYPNGGYGIAVANAENVTVDNNTVSGTDERIQAFGRRSDVSGLEATGNELTLGGKTADPQFRRWEPVTFTFDDAVQPDDGRYLTIRCYKIRLKNSGQVLDTYNMGVDEEGLLLESGYFAPETADSGAWRWFGGKDATTTLKLPASVLSAADTLELRAKPITAGLSGTVTIGGQPVEELTFQSDEIGWHEVAVPRSYPRRPAYSRSRGVVS
ncbi:MAG: right-handed parallel beta-helix repeat-containing protein [Halobacterium sp.]